MPGRDALCERLALRKVAEEAADEGLRAGAAREDQLSTREDGERARAREPRRTSPAPLVSTSSSLASGSTGKTVT